MVFPCFCFCETYTRSVVPMDLYVIDLDYLSLTVAQLFRDFKKRRKKVVESPMLSGRDFEWQNIEVSKLNFECFQVEPPLGPQKWTTRDRFKALGKKKGHGKRHQHCKLSQVRQFLENEKDLKLGDGVP